MDPGIKSDFQTPKIILIKILIADTGDSVAVQWLGGSPVVKNLPAVQETWVLSPGWEDPLEEGMATHSSILAWGFPWTEEPDGHRVRHD